MIGLKKSFPRWNAFLNGWFSYTIKIGAVFDIPTDQNRALLVLYSAGYRMHGLVRLGFNQSRKIDWSLQPRKVEKKVRLERAGFFILYLLHSTQDQGPSHSATICN